MFEKLFPKRQSAPSKQEPSPEPLELAIAALLVEAARADEHYDEGEKAIIEQSLMAQFAISRDEAHALRAKGEHAQENATDIQRFTRFTKGMPREDKIALIERLWEIVLSDGERDTYEDTLIRRICGLIYVEDRISGEARGRVAARLASQSGA